MGLFDSVHASCPKCGADVEFQSKAGECILAAFRAPGNVPVNIAYDVQGDSQLCECGHTVTISTKIHQPPPTLYLIVT